MFPSVWRRRDASSFGYATANHTEMRLISRTLDSAGRPVLPVSLTLVKEQARIAYPSSDDILALYTQSATEMVERYLRRALITQTWDFRTDWGPAWVELPFPNLLSVVNVFVTGLDNVENIVPTSVYIVDMEHNFVGLNIGNVWPLHRGKAGFRIQYTCGYGPTAASVPATIQRYIVALATTMDNTRDDVELSDSMESGLAPYRVYGEPYRMAKGMAREDLLA